MLQRRQGVELILEFTPYPILPLLRPLAKECRKVAGFAAQCDAPHDVPKHLGPSANELEGLENGIRLELVVRAQSVVGPRGECVRKGPAKQRKWRYARTIERLRLVDDQVGQFVAVRSGHDQHQIRRLRTGVDLIARRLEREHCVDSVAADQCMLGLVNDYQHRCLCQCPENFERIRERYIVREAGPGEIKRQGSHHGYLVEPRCSCQSGYHPFVPCNFALDRIGKQNLRRGLLVFPKVDIDRDPSSGCRFRNDVFAQERRLAHAARRREEQP